MQRCCREVLGSAAPRRARADETRAARGATVRYVVASITSPSKKPPVNTALLRIVCLPTLGGASNNQYPSATWGESVPGVAPKAFSGGKVSVNTGVWTRWPRRCCSLLPSMVTSRLTGSVASPAMARRAAMLQATPVTVGSQSYAPAPLITLAMGRNRAFPAGMVQCRVTGSPVNAEPRNHTGIAAPPRFDLPARHQLIRESLLVQRGASRP